MLKKQNVVSFFDIIFIQFYIKIGSLTINSSNALFQYSKSLIILFYVSNFFIVPRRLVSALLGTIYCMKPLKPIQYMPIFLENGL